MILTTLLLAVVTPLASLTAPHRIASEVDSSHAVMRMITLSTSPTRRASTDRLFESLQDLRRAEDSYYLSHKSYTADPSKLPEFQAPAGARIFITAGSTWVVLQGEMPEASIQQLTMWRKNGPQPVSSEFVGPGYKAK